MHLLAAEPGRIDDGDEAIDLRQSPAEMVVVTAADTELACLSAARDRLGDAAPGLRLVNLQRLKHPMSVDLWVDRTLAHARLVIVRLLGGTAYWPYGLERLTEIARARPIALVVIPGDDKPDASLDGLSTVSPAERRRVLAYFSGNGVGNACGLLLHAQHLLGRRAEPGPAPVPLPPAGLHPALAGAGDGTAADSTAAQPLHGLSGADIERIDAAVATGRPVAGIVFYRALALGGQTAAVDALAAALEAQGLAPLAIHAQSLKDPAAAAFVRAALDRARAAIVLNTTAFALGSATGVGGPARTPFDGLNRPVLQVVLSGASEAAWAGGHRGLGPADLAMHVSLPEIDGRVLTRAVAFKAEARWDPATECPILVQAPKPDRVDFVAALAAAWVRLGLTPPARRRVLLVVANYPNRDGRIGNGVGLDTPESVARILGALTAAGYDTGDAPTDGATLMARLLAGPTNDLTRRRASAATDDGDQTAGIAWSLDAYRTCLAAMPAGAAARISGRWGDPADDPFVADGAFRLPVHVFGRVAVAVQPARGYNIDPVESYHDPALPPPHGYAAFYGWARTAFGADAVVHVGKHGNLEWLPGKSLALSADCLPEAVLGPLPNLYPFIVNDPGEGAQAKRRTAAVVIDHLTPPLTRAGSYGPLGRLEALVDEYYEATGLDPRRLPELGRGIVAEAARLGLDKDCGVEAGMAEEAALARIDAHLCDIKELQIRDGLHIFGSSPDGDRLTELLVAILRSPRHAGQSGDASILRALALDLGLSDPADGGFDPLSRDFAAPWTGPKPAVLGDAAGWRSAGDTIERLEALAHDLVAGTRPADPAWIRATEVLAVAERVIRPAIEACGAAEMTALLHGLDGRFVAPGPSGAPTRGRPEVLPTGRNFFSLDSRSLPTPAAWTLGWKSAGLLVDAHVQEQGMWPRRMVLTAWGTANMRTGGDDIAQALALIGARPRWDDISGRVVGFEVLPAALLGRPRVDVVLRVSGFFRDAFPAQIDLFDSAVRAVAAMADEDDETNPIAAAMRDDRARLEADGADGEAAARAAGFRVFGSAPGAYGAGLQALIDEGGWTSRADLAEAYLTWGGHAYGAGAEGEGARGLFAAALSRADAVVQNQDNREHDLLDSDDYYQFEGGAAAAVETLSGKAPVVWHPDHSRPELPVIRTLDAEIARVVRGRAANPKWIAGVMRHGYKGAFEMAATVDYLFAFAATTNAVGNHHFDQLYDAYLADPAVRDFIAEANRPVLEEMAVRFAEAIDRGLWRPTRNAVHDELTALRAAGHAGRADQPLPETDR
ncbi:cobaltochelatase subunit CobN [Tistrella bauzanensis]|uniref:cobaltochelatase subunit CobN n=1 Tax=Tistrella TaxID=171436 RepID=UPI0031F62229